MKLDLGKYQIITDETQFIVQKKRIVQASKFTKAENVGKEVADDLAYCASLEYALKFLSKKVCFDNEELEDVIKEIKVLEGKIEGFAKALYLGMN